jgi:hypothetical protein
LLVSSNLKENEDVGLTPTQVQWAKEEEECDEMRDFGMYNTAVNSFASDEDRAVATAL